MYKIGIFITKLSTEPDGKVTPVRIKVGEAKYPTMREATNAAICLTKIPKGTHVWEQDFSDDDTTNIRTVVKHFGGYGTSKITEESK